MSVEVLQPGMHTTIQAGPRTGLRHLGVPAGGAADPLSLALANRLVGNPPFASALEVSYVGPRLRFTAPAQFALAGAETDATLGGTRVAFHRTLAAAAGDELVLPPVAVGARLYVAFAGGLEAEEVLGSASTCLPAGFGGYRGRALESGDVLGIAAAAGAVAALETPAEFRPPMTHSWVMRVCRAADSERLLEGQRSVLFDGNWTIGRRADRMGLALEGATLGVDSDGRMPSAPVFPGTIQCPQDGLPYLLSVDAQTTGGYPRIAQVARADRHLLGQLRPGDRLRLLPRAPEEAIDELRAKHDFWRRWLPGVEAVI